jgi:protein-S-isoprenylcysteine O-methyltransferase Ste14
MRLVGRNELAKGCHRRAMPNAIRYPPMMRATGFEFRNRWWLFGGLFGIAFLCAAFDQTPAGERIADYLAAATHCTQLQALHLVFGIAALILLGGALLRTWGSAYLSRQVVHDHAVHGEVLHADGPYRYLRNPLYFGNVLLALTIGLIAPAAGYALLMVGMIVFCYRLIGREEAVLEAGQGQRFREYARSVPRLWPSLRAHVAPARGGPDWISGLAAEAFFWSYALGLVAFALSLNILWVYASLLLSPLASWLAGLAVRNHRPPA